MSTLDLNDLTDLEGIDSEIITANKPTPNTDINPSDSDAAIAKAAETTIHKVNDINDKFQLVQESVSKIGEYKTIKIGMLAQEAISRSDAQYINQVIGGLISRVSLEEFTKTPSKVNYQYTLKFVNKHIAKEQLAAGDNYKIFIKESLHNALVILNEVLDTYQSTTSLVLNNLITEYSANSKDILTNKNNTVSYDKSFVNLLELDITTIDFTKLKLPFLKCIYLNTFVENIKYAFDNKFFKYFFISSIKNLPVVLNPEPIDEIQYKDTVITIADLIKFFSTSSAKEILASIEDQARDLIAELEHIADSINIIKNQEIETIINEESPNIVLCITKTKHITACITNLGLLVTASEKLLELIRKL